MPPKPDPPPYFPPSPGLEPSYSTSYITHTQPSSAAPHPLGFGPTPLPPPLPQSVLIYRSPQNPSPHAPSHAASSDRRRFLLALFWVVPISVLAAFLLGGGLVG